MVQPFLFSFILLLFAREGRLEVVVPLLEALREQGLSISLHLSQYLREALGEGITTAAVIDLLAELSSGELIPIELDPCPARLHWTTKPQVVKLRQDFSRLARERKLDEALASKKVAIQQLVLFQYATRNANDPVSQLAIGKGIGSAKYSIHGRDEFAAD